MRLFPSVVTTIWVMATAENAAHYAAHYKRGGGAASRNGDTPDLDTNLSKLVIPAHYNATVWISRSLIKELSSSSSNHECIQKGTENQYEDKNIILMIADFKDLDPALATPDFNVIG